MATDIQVDRDFTTSLNARGDFTAVDGDAYLVQRTIFRILSVAISWKGETITPQRVEEYRSAVDDAIANDDEIDEPTAVRVKRVEATQVTLAVDLGEQQLIVTGP